MPKQKYTCRNCNRILDVTLVTRIMQHGKPFELAVAICPCGATGMHITALRPRLTKEQRDERIRLIQAALIPEIGVPATITVASPMLDCFITWKCPRCSEWIPLFFTMDGEKATLPGKASVCAGCGCVLWTPGLIGIRLATEQEIARLSDEDKFIIRESQELTLQRHLAGIDVSITDDFKT
jgi:RNase P subunit RPR2